MSKTVVKYGVLIGVVIALVVGAVFTIKSLFSGNGPFGRLVDWLTGNDEATKQKNEEEQRRQQDYVKHVEEEIDNQIVSIPPSYTDAQYERQANAIYKAADGWTEDDTEIYNELKKCKNITDWRKLVVAFGTRTLSKFTGKVSVDLPAIITDYLDNTHKYWLNNYFYKIGIEHIG